MSSSIVVFVRQEMKIRAAKSDFSESSTSHAEGLWDWRGKAGHMLTASDVIYLHQLI